MDSLITFLPYGTALFVFIINIVWVYLAFRFIKAHEKTADAMVKQGQIIESFVKDQCKKDQRKDN